ncbi:MAG: aminotransferase class I/II-fold pyridoxal phosphate-dependent enzyme [Clostridia bacterium]|jgi:dTDP-4-amino-4,6-dideoxygalactose transaminase|nr:aminotransferase class I/II-fold pyridoxal phosphate-dependent enzyme [Clostridia bacterium]
MSEKLRREKLAIEGGKPVKTTPNLPMFPGGLEIGQEEKKAVLEVLDHKYLFRYYGPEEFSSRVKLLEEEFAKKMGVKYALAVNSCTSALITSLIAVGVGPGDEVIIPGYTFFASCAAVIAARAIPVIAEVDDSLTLDPEDLERKITPRTKAVMPVHMRGAPCNMDEIMEIAKNHNLKVVEDAAQACGGSYKGRYLGTFGDCNTFSFQYHKIITAGEGGMVTTDDELLYDRAQGYHDVAACWRPGGPGKRFGSARYKGELFPGVNFRMSELIGAVTRVQLRRLDGLIERMRKNKKRIKDAISHIKGIQFRRLNDPEGDTAIALFFSLPTAELTKKFAKDLRAEGVEANSIYNKGVPDWHIYSHWEMIINKWTVTAEGCPYTCPHYKGPEIKYSADMLPKTLDLLSKSIQIDIPPQLTKEDCHMIARGVHKVADAYL